MTDWASRFESAIDRQLRAAEERGEFDDLPGAGKPLPALDQPYRENWWLENLVERENAGRYALPLPLALRKEAEEFIESLAGLRNEDAVREAVEYYNTRVREARRVPQAGPAIVLKTLDVEQVVEAWRTARDPLKNAPPSQ